MAQSALLNMICAAGGGLLMGAAVARAVAPGNYFDCTGSVLVPWLICMNWPQQPQMQGPAAAVVCGAFVGYNFMRHTRWCD
jgi:hypothetical protein